ncbi:MAG: ImmA/IrrE family metallo-endopeptidase [Moorellaceae bacterium]
MASTVDDRIAAEVDRLIREHGTRDPFELADKLGLVTRWTKLPAGYLGTVWELWGVKVILLAIDTVIQEARYIVAHEIFHHLDEHPEFWWVKKTFFGNYFEVLADRFAAELLIQETPYGGETEYEFAARLGVPIRLIRLWVKRVA